MPVAVGTAVTHCPLHRPALAEFVSVSRVKPVVAYVAITRTDGILTPELSVTVPVIEELLICAEIPGRGTAAAKTETIVLILVICVSVLRRFVARELISTFLDQRRYLIARRAASYILIEPTRRLLRHFKTSSTEATHEVKRSKWLSRPRKSP